MFTLLMLGSGIFWTATYILIIRRSFLDHTYGMPLVALCANISWEAIFSFIYPPFIIQHVVNLVWFVLDMVIFIQLLRYGPREFADLSKRAFYGVCSLTLLTGFGAVFLMTIEFHDSGVYSAFGQNLMMYGGTVCLDKNRPILRVKSAVRKSRYEDSERYTAKGV